jgi:DNA-binding CsgD family transcriptional regulator
MASSDSLATQLLSGALSLSDATTLTQMQQGASQLLSSLIACDEVLWAEFNITTSTAIVRRGHSMARDATLSRTLGRYGDQHPAVLSYRSPGDDSHPRRVSDVTSYRKWLSSPAYGEIFRGDRARFQLSLVISLADGIGRGWVLTRSSVDFTDTDVDTAALSLPVLVTLDRLAHVKFRRTPPARASMLSSRELQVLHLLTTGMTANAIGRAIGITEATVRKHTEHIYRKLECNDRLTAVLRARKLGIVHS